jgi:CheY-like chemotaxis protein
MRAIPSLRLYTPFDEKENPPHLLLAEDDTALLRLMALRLKALGYNVHSVSDGNEAWAYAQQHGGEIDVAVFDHVMPGADGLELLRRMQNTPELCHLPVVLHTASDKPEQIVRGIEAGAFYYLVKPCPEEMLHAVVAAAVREALQYKQLVRDVQRQRGGFRLLDSANLTLRTLEEAENAACWLAHAFDDPLRVVGGLAALLLNAVEHGNAGVGFKDKGLMLENGNWRQAVAERLDRPENQRKRVRVELQRLGDRVSVEIADEGEGFDWHNYMMLDPARAQASHGRGIARAATLCFDRISYNSVGNVATVWVEG